MGFAKALKMAEEVRGWRTIKSRSACADCVGEEALAEYVRTYADSMTCDYCDQDSATDPIAVDLDAILEQIATGLASEYSDPADELPFESAEGGFQGEVVDTDEVFERADCDIADERLRKDLIAAFGDRTWCRRNYFRLPRDQALMAGWERFTDIVLRHTRYVFLADQGPGEFDREIPDAALTLHRIGETVEEAELVHSYPAGTRWFRARVHRPGDTLHGAKALGSPPADVAAANRMSPAGISMFYGTQERETAIAEVMGVPENASCSLATVGTFVSARPMSLVNLTNLPRLPSLFDERRGYQRAAIRFLHEFTEELSRPVSRDGFEHLEYVPTQVVTEWFRHIFKSVDGEAVAGIAYPSARDTDGTCCVLFVDREGCRDMRPGWDEDPNAWLALESTSNEVVHLGFNAFLGSPEFENLRRLGLEVFQRETLFSLEEWSEFVLHGERTPAYQDFVGECRRIAAQFDIDDNAARRACLQHDYHPELEPFLIEGSPPQFTVVASGHHNPLFWAWLIYEAWRLDLRVASREAGRPDIVVISVPFPAKPSEPLADAQRPPLPEAFTVGSDMSPAYPPAAAGAAMAEHQQLVHELLRRLGYVAD